MNGSQSAKIYMVAMLALLTALLVGAVFFLAGMQSSSYLVSNGAEYSLQFIDQPRYEWHLVGLVYSAVFLLASLFLLAIVAIPDERILAAFRRVPVPPQPRRRRGPAVTPEALAEAAAPLREAPPPAAAPPAPPPAAPPAAPAPPEPGAPVAPVAAEAPEVPTATEAAAPVQPPPARPTSAPDVPVDEAVQQEAEPEISAADLPEASPDISGEEDVVYGNGPVTEESIFDFIQSYPDSAVKFLYRKNLDNRPLPPIEEDIYQRWERRGMSRGKVRQLVLELMEWERLPDDFPHSIWMRIRDRIYDLQTHV